MKFFSLLARRSLFFRSLEYHPTVSRTRLHFFFFFRHRERSAHLHNAPRLFKKESFPRPLRAPQIAPPRSLLTSEVSFRFGVPRLKLKEVNRDALLFPSAGDLDLLVANPCPPLCSDI